MTAIIVSAHAALAEGLLGAVSMIAGEQELLYGVHFLPGEGLTDLITRVAEQIQSSGADKALVLTDLFGASPANAASAALFSVDAETAVVTGVNLAALLEAVLTRDDGVSLAAFAARVAQAGRDNIRPITKETVLNAGGVNA
ncbi:MAG TPA: PTS fructose transporter subunit IIA [Feifaniaceae bacterium]|nr:PTS fructose transporter subunit IIA [Feifaniaceae bacterium]